MKHQQVVVDYWSMVKTSFTCLLLALSGYVLIKMVQTIFWLPGYLQNNQKRLEELAAKYAVDPDVFEEEKKLEKLPAEKSTDNPTVPSQVEDKEEKKDK